MEKQMDKRTNVKRFRSATSNMVGMFRLLTEQFSESYTDVFKEYTETSKKSFVTLKKHIRREVFNNVCSPETVKKVINNYLTEKGSLNELLFGAAEMFPKQAILIRVGNSVEVAIQNYLSNRFENVKDELDPVIHSFLDRHIQMDVAIKKDNTYFVSELKYNFNLDTEKINKIVEKLDLFSITLKKFYKGKANTNVTLVSLRYPYAKDIINLKPELKAIKGQYILGYVEFFKMFGIEVTQKEWERFHKQIGEEVLEVYSSAYLDKYIN
jgi:hypothetical protein